MGVLAVASVTPEFRSWLFKELRAPAHPPGRFVDTWGALWRGVEASPGPAQFKVQMLGTISHVPKLFEHETP
eukprot:6982307-Alexandrium_andersonii.AAC.1